MDKSVVAGVDEVGRGALFGPVVAAAVILQAGMESVLESQGVRDSKSLTPLRREALVGAIADAAIDVKIGYASVRCIDRINILQASLLAMRRAVMVLAVAPTLCLVDGNQLIPELGLPQETVVKGDQSVIAIAAASIVAKVWRDRLIERLASRYPGYDLSANKGYGTYRHRQALERLGPTALHRRSFKYGKASQPKKLKKN